MLNLPLIYKVLGTLLQIEAMLMAVCFGMSFWFKESFHLTFGLPTLIAFAIGALLLFFGRHAENRMGRRDGFLIVSLTWIVFSVIGMLPFLIGGYQPRVQLLFLRPCQALRQQELQPFRMSTFFLVLSCYGDV